tara:strand:+ start:387 stop:647 length:261 start_codon:yes stop_codon:yes gene_type:complete
MLAGATLLAISVFWTQIKDFFLGFRPKVKPYVPKDTTSEDSSLVEIIRCWEHLKIGCKEAGLIEAGEELDKIFPLFVPSSWEINDV